MERPFKQFVAAKAFIEHEGKILVVRESAALDVNTQVGKCDVIGGRLEKGESLEVGLRREVLEEVGLDFKDWKPFYANDVVREVKDETWHIVRVFFICSVTNTSVRLSEEHDEFDWIDPVKYQECNVIDNLHEAFDAYLNMKT